MLSFNQVTVIQGDAADVKTIQDVVSRVVKEEGRLDVFFANVSSYLISIPAILERTQSTNVFKLYTFHVHDVPQPCTLNAH